MFYAVLVDLCIFMINLPTCLKNEELALVSRMFFLRFLEEEEKVFYSLLLGSKTFLSIIYERFGADIFNLFVCF